MIKLSYLYDTIKIQKHLLDLFNKWKINSKICAIITDNNLNIKKAYNKIEIGKRISYAAVRELLRYWFNMLLEYIAFDTCR